MKVINHFIDSFYHIRYLYRSYVLGILLARKQTVSSNNSTLSISLTNSISVGLLVMRFILREDMY
jgi:hypothetical protein